MARAFKPVVLTANALEGGEAVWWTGAGWSPRFQEAKPAETPEQAKLLESLAAAPIFAGLVVGAYLAAVGIADEGLDPLTRREAIRASAEPTFDYLPGARERTEAA